MTAAIEVYLISEYAEDKVVEHKIIGTVVRVQKRII